VRVTHAFDRATAHCRRRARFKILPLAFFGSSSRKTMSRGTLKDDKSVSQNAVITAASDALD
jgi:hypothetical protein